MRIHKDGVERPSGKKPCVAVIGAAACPPEEARTAEAIGRGIADIPADLVCGGLGGVMEAAARGARRQGARTIGILPGIDKEAANPYIDVIIPTGMGQARNVLVVLAADVVLAVGGEFGTLSEIGLALKHDIPVVGLNTWPIGERAGAEDIPFFPTTSVEHSLDTVRRLLASNHGRYVKGGEGG